MEDKLKKRAPACIHRTGDLFSTKTGTKSLSMPPCLEMIPSIIVIEPDLVGGDDAIISVAQGEVHTPTTRSQHPQTIFIYPAMEI